jgi:uncharacterized protein YcbX
MSEQIVSIAGLYVHPVKSCARIEVERALVTETGLEWDRQWMVVDEQGVFVSQREAPRLALVRPTLRASDLLRAPGIAGVAPRARRDRARDLGSDLERPRAGR